MTSTRCDKCKSVNIESMGQINLLQYKFYCKMCHEDFILTETDELKICKKCSGTGVFRVNDVGISCKVCEALGYLDWTTAVLKGQI